jgi:hypothetical protein
LEVDYDLKSMAKFGNLVFPKYYLGEDVSKLKKKE